MSEVDIFLIGVPKAGTTWLANTLNQHKEIILSDPKEPNIIASHKGTFIRQNESPDWEKLETCFQGEGLRLDASIHAFACPLAPSRIRERLPEARFILCLREPVSRSHSHWNMVLNTKEAETNNVDWSTFEKAWNDNHLKEDSLYATSMSRWLDQFSLERFLIINSFDLKNDPTEVLIKIENFLGINNSEYDLSSTRHSNSAAGRRPISKTGKLVRIFFSIIPNIIKKPIVKLLQKRDLNIYNLPLLSNKGEEHHIDSGAYSICGKELVEELLLFEQLTNFPTTKWIDKINLEIKQAEKFILPYDKSGDVS